MPVQEQEDEGAHDQGQGQAPYRPCQSGGVPSAHGTIVLSFRHLGKEESLRTAGARRPLPKGCWHHGRVRAGSLVRKELRRLACERHGQEAEEWTAKWAPERREAPRC